MLGAVMLVMSLFVFRAPISVEGLVRNFAAFGICIFMATLSGAAIISPSRVLRTEHFIAPASACGPLSPCWFLPLSFCCVFARQAEAEASASTVIWQIYCSHNIAYNTSISGPVTPTHTFRPRRFTHKQEQ